MASGLTALTSPLMVWKPILEVRVFQLCCQRLDDGLKDGAGDGYVMDMSLPHPGMQGIIQILEVSLLHPLVLGTKALDLVDFLVIISLLEPGGEGVEGYIKVLGNLGLGLESLLHLQDGLVLCVESVGFVFGSHCGIASNDYHSLLSLLKYCPLGQLHKCQHNSDTQASELHLHLSSIHLLPELQYYDLEP